MWRSSEAGSNHRQSRLRPRRVRKTAGKRAIRGARRVPRRSAVGRSAAAAVGRPVGRPVAATMRSVGRVAVSVSVSHDVKTPEFRGSFSLKLLEHCQICASRRIKGGKLKAILKYISQNKNKVDASRRAEKCRSLRVRKRGKVEMRPSAMRAGRPCTAQGVAESVRSDTAPQPGTTSSGPQA